MPEISPGNHHRPVVTIRRLALIAPLVAIAHYMASVAVLLRNFGSTMRDFDTGGPPHVTPADRAFELLQHALFFPLVAPLGDLWPTAIRTGAFPLQHVPFIANSMLWAFTMVALVWLRRRRAA